MKKFILAFCFVFGIFILGGCGGNDKVSVINKVYRKVNNTRGYQIESEMQIMNGDNAYNYDVTVSYKKKNYYRVSLKNKTNNHEQIILKNDDGVYV